ncbi:MAG: PaaI family thioesterase [Pseudomonadota bacterium]|nr:PaaI family thioesterase [Pseudomonadota bacterium]
MSRFFTKRSMLSYLDEVFPQVSGRLSIESLHEKRATLQLLVNDGDLRPGGTVSGPSMFLLADVAFYVLVLYNIGKKPLAVTTNCSINFLRKPEPGHLTGEARLLKIGKTLVVGDVSIKSPINQVMVAHACFTYSIPK